ncbi:MAG: hypothetical protein KC492_21255 [Myxococcales bacterium]|nr:hypothetical protein [Myxococcales bacterium]
MISAGPLEELRTIVRKLKKKQITLAQTRTQLELGLAQSLRWALEASDPQRRRGGGPWGLDDELGAIP